MAEDAAEAIVEAARARPGELTLVTLGPLTNVALALQREPDLPHLLRRTGDDGRLVPLARQHGADHGVERRGRPGGAGRGPGRLAGGARRPTRAVALPVAFGLDVTERAKLTPAHLERLATRAGGEAGATPWCAS